MQAHRYPPTIDVRELLTVAIHESSHLWVAQQLGCTGLKLSITGVQRGVVEFVPPKGMSAHGLRIIGLAGLAGEMLAVDDHLQPDAVMQAAAAGDWRLSREDRVLCGAVDHRLASDCIDLLQMNRTGVRQYAAAEVEAYLQRLRAGGRP